MIGIQYVVNVKDGKNAEALDIVRRERDLATGPDGFCRELLIWQRMTGTHEQLLLTYIVESLASWEQILRSLPDEFKSLVEEGWQHMDRRIEAHFVRIIE